MVPVLALMSTLSLTGCGIFSMMLHSSGNDKPGESGYYAGRVEKNEYDYDMGRNGKILCEFRLGEAFAVYYDWDGTMADNEILIPDTVVDPKNGREREITALGGFIGVGVPTGFEVSKRDDPNVNSGRTIYEDTEFSVDENGRGDRIEDIAFWLYPGLNTDIVNMGMYSGRPVTAPDGTVTYYLPRYVPVVKSSVHFTEKDGILYYKDGERKGEKFENIYYLRDADYYEFAYDGRPIKEETAAGLILPTDEEKYAAFTEAAGALPTEELAPLRSDLLQRFEETSAFDDDYWKRQNMNDPGSEDWKGIEEIMEKSVTSLKDASGKLGSDRLQADLQEMINLSEEISSEHDIGKYNKLTAYYYDLCFWVLDCIPNETGPYGRGTDTHYVEGYYYGKLSVFPHHANLHNYALLEDGSYLCCAQMYPYRVVLEDGDYTYVLLSDTRDLSVSDISDLFQYTGKARAVVVEADF